MILVIRALDGQRQVLRTDTNNALSHQRSICTHARWDVAPADGGRRCRAASSRTLVQRNRQGTATGHGVVREFAGLP
jgi:hypothetical protein